MLKVRVTHHLSGASDITVTDYIGEHFGFGHCCVDTHASVWDVNSDSKQVVMIPVRIGDYIEVSTYPKPERII